MLHYCVGTGCRTLQLRSGSVAYFNPVYIIKKDKTRLEVSEILYQPCF
jgi:hypothetical protein